MPIHWPHIQRATHGGLWRSSALGLALLGIFLLISLPFMVEKYILKTLQNDLQQSAAGFTQKLTRSLETQTKGMHRAVLAAPDAKTQFGALSKAWLGGAPDAIAVNLLDHQGRIINTASKAPFDALRDARFIADGEPINRISLAHALELQEPAFSALYQIHGKSLVDLIIPRDGPQPLAYVVTLDTQKWADPSAEGARPLFSMDVLPFRTDLAEDYDRYYINTVAWEGLWTLKFQSKDPLFGLLQNLRPVFFALTWLITGLFFLYWRSSRLRQKVERELQAKSEILEKQNRLSLLGEMSAQLAHEINQPLATIANYAVAGKLQLQSAHPNSALASLFQEILEQSQRAGQVLVAVRSLLQPSPMELSRSNVDDIIHKLEPSLHFLCAPHQVILDVTCSSSLTAHLNPLLFEQVIFNMVKNSIQSLAESDRPEKRISIKGASHHGRIRVEISDNGPGIQAAHAAHIFDSFFTTKAEGLGIGLSLCRSVIERFNGKLTLKSNNSQGVCFLIDMPAFHPAPERLSV
jgi:signal transduction histidine kinase